jgi:hypothetical protein
MFFSDDFGGDREQDEYLVFGETSFAIVQDWILWGRVTWDKLDTNLLLQDELLDIEPVVRGAEDLEGAERGAISLEFRFPLWRDFLWQPLEVIGLGEWLILKDLRGVAFGQHGYAGFALDHAWDREFTASSAGLGLRLDFSFMLWPVVNGRVPVRAEFWWAIVEQEAEPLHGAVGFGLQMGY